MEARTEKTLKAITSLLDSGNAETILVGASDILAGILRDFATALSNSETAPTSGRDTVLRCIGCKAQETWDAILALVRANHSPAAMTLLRPMTEEMIFAHFLLLLPPASAEEYLHTSFQIERFEMLIAEDAFFPAVAAHFPFIQSPVTSGNLELIKRTRAAIADARKQLKNLTLQPGWPQGPCRSVRDRARMIGMEPYYDFIYRASSSAVHASVHELNRMVRIHADNPRLRISHQQATRHYRDFVLTYGGWIASFTATLLAGQFPSLFPADANESLSIMTAFFIVPAIKHSSPGLIMPAEL
jgi:hypothetical protein